MNSRPAYCVLVEQTLPEPSLDHNGGKYEMLTIISSIISVAVSLILINYNILDEKVQNIIYPANN